jgi:hypothetical protein
VGRRDVKRELGDGGLLEIRDVAPVVDEDLGEGRVAGPLDVDVELEEEGEGEAEAWGRRGRGGRT